ncbi:MAG: molybdate transport system substrate-binding protein [Gaiellaceae bacterium]|jgi:molybdate transport system substrate-binding protein|nr:molybdate transport system substrate-binding protein [Gaiellaceae bacterium]
MRVAALAAAALGALAVVPAAATHAGATPPTVYAASSLTEVFSRIDSRPHFSFAGSDQLAFQIRQGAPADVFAAASPKYPQQLFAEGLVAKPVVFATNELVLIVPRSNPAKIHSAFDLRRSGIKLVIGQAGVPIGDYTRQVLANLGLADVAATAVDQEPDVKGIVTKIALGEGDAGFVYRTDVAPVRKRVGVIRLRASAQPRVEYQIAVVRSSKHAAAARAFVRRVLGPVGRKRLAAAGFGLPKKK